MATCKEISRAEIYIAGKRGARDTNDLLRVVYDRLIPGKTLFLVDHNESSNILFRKNEHLSRMKPLDGRATAYVCRHHTCSLPVTDPERLVVMLEEQRHFVNEQLNLVDV